MVSDRRTNLADPSAALVSYLDDLLHTATSGVTEEKEEGLEVVVQEVREPAPAPETAPVISAPVEPERARPPKPMVTETRRSAEPVIEAPSAKAEQAAGVDQAPLPVEPEGRPDWSEKPFECLIFRVAGLQLAVPLVLLGAIHRMDEKVKPIPGRPPWYMGMLLDRGQKLKVVDSAEWIMAGRVPAGARDGYRFVIRLDDSDWALACDEVAESFTLNPDQVRWRSARSKRPWLAGTVVQHMCALIDVGAMARLLARAEREHRLDLD
ncbi:purine-binding chemotaxis protein CheW [Marinobacter daqiaonensis]|uniref:Purine-binding chemotaxis protein CheW n=1 Tax=Marinobacter daqiaonensis TaxID=650891 RepID=A0A1I6H5Y6_9GAMM|nr:chemotaxis protein CheW [Marinobacter daqiaonensis]SFR49848.1 purine-binding chemotaxis protein CheW [Marinobacter daqiaonensis]